MRIAGHDVYDFRNPRPGDHGFAWSEVDAYWQQWTPAEFRHCLQHPVARRGFERDFEAMKWADACVLVMPCGRRAHREAGWFAGAGKPVVILLSDGEAELMYAMTSRLCVDIGEVLTFCEQADPARKAKEERA